MLVVSGLVCWAHFTGIRPTSTSHPADTTPHPISKLLWRHTLARARQPQAAKDQLHPKERRKETNEQRRKKEKTFTRRQSPLTSAQNAPRVPRGWLIQIASSPNKASRRCNKAAVSLGLIIIDRYPGTDAAHAAAPRSQQAQNIAVSSHLFACETLLSQLERQSSGRNYGPWARWWRRWWGRGGGGGRGGFFVRADWGDVMSGGGSGVLLFPRLNPQIVDREKCKTLFVRLEGSSR